MQVYWVQIPPGKLGQLEQAIAASQDPGRNMLKALKALGTAVPLLGAMEPLDFRGDQRLSKQMKASVPMAMGRGVGLVMMTWDVALEVSLTGTNSDPSDSDAGWTRMKTAVTLQRPARRGAQRLPPQNIELFKADYAGAVRLGRPFVAISDHAPVGPPADRTKLPDNSVYVVWAKVIKSNTMSELVAKGLPPISVPRKRALVQTARQTTEEVVADLGNFFVVSDSADRDGAYSLGTIRRWGRTIPRNLKVLRLIEEGREDPARLSRLLRQAILEALSAYDDLIEAKKKPLPPSAVSGVRLNDPYYAKHKRYRSHSFERGRIHFVAIASFYVLANIGEMNDGKLLRAWIAQEKPDATCRAMDVWLIDQWCATETGRRSSYAAKYKELAGTQAISGKRKKISKWNAPWEARHPLLVARQVDPSDLPTIEVLDIPDSLAMTTERRKQIISEFLKATKGQKP